MINVGITFYFHFQGGGKLKRKPKRVFSHFLQNQKFLSAAINIKELFVYVIFQHCCDFHVAIDNQRHTICLNGVGPRPRFTYCSRVLKLQMQLHCK